MKAFAGRVVSGLIATFVCADAFAADSLVTFRPEATLTLFDAAYRTEARESADPDAWRYLKPEVKGAVQYLERKHGFKAAVAYSAVMRGFAADLTRAQIDALGHEPMIESIAVTVDVASVTEVDQTTPWGVSRIGAGPRAADGDGVRAPDVTGVTVYVVDSGIDESSGDLNVTRHVNFSGAANTDCTTHGTHVAGIIGAQDNDIGVVGVAPGVPLVDVRVMDCAGKGTSATLIKGLDWIAAHAEAPAVVNMSIGGSAAPLLDAAVRKAASMGFFFAIAAGNTASDACLSSPSATGAEMGIVTVSATNQDDQEPAFANFGSCVDLWAPGISIVSTAKGPDGGVTTLSGTSMAAPHAAGAAALYLSAYPKAAPSEVESVLVAASAIPGTASKDGRTILRLTRPNP